MTPDSPSPVLTDNSKRLIRQCLKVIYGTVQPNPQITLLQFTVVLQALSHDGLKQKDLSELTSSSQGTISKAVAKLGPNGTNCLNIDNGLIKADDHVIEAFNAISDS